jgi:2-methylisocitrate lyase-like PEP mutase family enzyme
MQHQKYTRFVQLHHQDQPLLLANPWDAGSAKLLASVGFEALATSSAGYAFSVGRLDSAAGLSRPELLDNARQIVQATALPVTADLEDGFGASPQTCAETVSLACELGLVGGSIEDASGDPAAPIYDLQAAVERIQAAAQALRGRPFVLTARAENYLCGRPDLADTIARLQAFSAAGADVLYAPGLPDLDAIKTVCRELDKPVNVVLGLAGPRYRVAELAEAGVKRISVGGSFARAALGGLLRAAQELREQGSCNYLDDALPGSTLSPLMSPLHLSNRL